MKNFIQCLIILIILLLTGSTNVFHDQPKTGYWALKGTIKTHIFKDENDSLSGPEIFELQNDNGLPIWFGREIFKDVCMSGVCKMIRLWVFWDGAGNYLGIQTLDQEPLTKSDHTLFEDADYAKLDEILKDTASVLKTLKQEELIIVPDSINPFEIDGYTAATQPALAEVIVKDAVYTCHTLWHTVYGPSQKAVENILMQRLSKEYLTAMFETQKPSYISWAIKTIEKHPTYHESFYKKIMEYITSDNSSLSKQALDYFKPVLMENESIQYEFAELFEKVDINIKYEILWKYIKHGNTGEFVILNILKTFNEQNMGIGTYNLILRLIKPEHLKNNSDINKIITSMSKHENDYIKNLSLKLLEASN